MTAHRRSGVRSPPPNHLSPHLAVPTPCLGWAATGPPPGSREIWTRCAIPRPARCPTRLPRPRTPRPKPPRVATRSRRRANPPDRGGPAVADGAYLGAMRIDDVRRIALGTFVRPAEETGGEP